MDLDKLKKRGNRYSALIVTPIEGLQENINQACKQLVETGNPLLYVSLNKPHGVVKAALEEKGIATDKIFFVDTIAKSLGQATPEEHVVHVENPADLTSLQIAISEFLEKIERDKSILIDALATLLIYNSEELAVKFIRDVLEKSAESRTVVFTPSAKGTGFVEKISVFFDEVMESPKS